MNIDKLKGLMVEKKIDRETLAKALGISVKTVGNKLSNVSEFNVDEFITITQLLRLNDDEILKLLNS